MAAADDRPRGAPVLPDADAVRQHLSQVIERVEGLTLGDPPEVIGADAPAAMLLPGSEQLAAYEHLWTVSARYGRPGGVPEIICHIHRFGAQMDAYGPFALRKDVAAQDALAIPTRAYGVSGQLPVWRGSDYAHFFADQSDNDLPPAAGTASPIDETARTLIGLVAEAALEILPVPGRLPRLLSLVPLPGRFIGPVRYERITPAGGDETVERVMVRLIETHESDCLLSIYRAADAPGARRLYEEWLEGLADGAEAAEMMPLLAQEAAVVSGAEGPVGACMLQDNYVACVEGGQSRAFAEALLMIVASHVRILLTVGDLASG